MSVRLVSEPDRIMNVQQDFERWIGVRTFDLVAIARRLHTGDRVSIVRPNYESSTR